MKTNTSIRRKRETGSFPVSWVMKKIDRYRERKREARSRDELMKLGEHLLRDLGLDREGRPLNPQRRTGRIIPELRTKQPAWSEYRRRRTCSTPRTAPEIHLACLR